MKKLIFLTLLVSSLFSCTNASEDDLIVPAQQLPDPVTYEAHVKPIIQSNCLNCHGNPPQNGAPISLNSYPDVSNAYVNGGLLNRISSQPGESGFMPVGGARLSQFSIDIIEKWEADGFQVQ